MPVVTELFIGYGKAFLETNLHLDPTGHKQLQRKLGHREHDQSLGWGSSCPQARNIGIKATNSAPTPHTSSSFHFTFNLKWARL